MAARDVDALGMLYPTALQCIVDPPNAVMRRSALHEQNETFYCRKSTLFVKIRMYHDKQLAHLFDHDDFIDHRVFVFIRHVIHGTSSPQWTANSRAQRQSLASMPSRYPL